jgi:hypothetical protein
MFQVTQKYLYVILVTDNMSRDGELFYISLILINKNHEVVKKMVTDFYQPDTWQSGRS